MRKQVDGWPLYTCTQHTRTHTYKHTQYRKINFILLFSIDICPSLLYLDMNSPVEVIKLWTISQRGKDRQVKVTSSSLLQHCRKQTGPGRHPLSGCYACLISETLISKDKRNPQSFYIAVHNYSITYQKDFNGTKNIHGFCKCGAKIKAQAHSPAKFGAQGPGNHEV